jgi:hypothetical protein
MIVVALQYSPFLKPIPCRCKKYHITDLTYKTYMNQSGKQTLGTAS